MSYFMGNDYIVADSLAFNKSLLRWVDVIRKVRL
jgi:hypothetical protein